MNSNMATVNHSARPSTGFNSIKEYQERDKAVESLKNKVEDLAQNLLAHFETTTEISEHKVTARLNLRSGPLKDQVLDNEEQAMVATINTTLADVGKTLTALNELRKELNKLKFESDDKGSATKSKAYGTLHTFNTQLYRISTSLNSILGEQKELDKCIKCTIKEATEAYSYAPFLTKNALSDAVNNIFAAFTLINQCRDDLPIHSDKILSCCDDYFANLDKPSGLNSMNNVAGDIKSKLVYASRLHFALSAFFHQLVNKNQDDSMPALEGKYQQFHTYFDKIKDHMLADVPQRKADLDNIYTHVSKLVVKRAEIDLNLSALKKQQEIFAFYNRSLLQLVLDIDALCKDKNAPVDAVRNAVFSRSSTYISGLINSFKKIQDGCAKHDELVNSVTANLRHHQSTTSILPGEEGKFYHQDLFPQTALRLFYRTVINEVKPIPVANNMQVLGAMAGAIQLAVAGGAPANGNVVVKDHRHLADMKEALRDLMKLTTDSLKQNIVVEESLMPTNSPFIQNKMLLTYSLLMDMLHDFAYKEGSKSAAHKIASYTLLDTCFSKIHPQLVDFVPQYKQELIADSLKFHMILAIEKAVVLESSQLALNHNLVEEYKNNLDSISLLVNKGWQTGQQQGMVASQMDEADPCFALLETHNNKIKALHRLYKDHDAAANEVIRLSEALAECERQGLSPNYIVDRQTIDKAQADFAKSGQDLKAAM